MDCKHVIQQHCWNTAGLDLIPAMIGDCIGIPFILTSGMVDGLSSVVPLQEFNANLVYSRCLLLAKYHISLFKNTQFLYILLPFYLSKSLIKSSVSTTNTAVKKTDEALLNDILEEWHNDSPWQVGAWWSKKARPCKRGFCPCQSCLGETRWKHSSMSMTERSRYAAVAWMVGEVLLIANEHGNIWTEWLHLPFSD